METDPLFAGFVENCIYDKSLGPGVEDLAQKNMVMYLNIVAAPSNVSIDAPKNVTTPMPTDFTIDAILDKVVTYHATASIAEPIPELRVREKTFSGAGLPSPPPPAASKSNTDSSSSTNTDSSSSNNNNGNSNSNSGSTSSGGNTYSTNNNIGKAKRAPIAPIGSIDGEDNMLKLRVALDAPIIANGQSPVLDAKTE
jgi:hypothetical protein